MLLPCCLNAFCPICILSHLYFVTFALCLICILSYLHLVRFAFCFICILSYLHFVIFAICRFCILSDLHFVVFLHFVCLHFVWIPFLGLFSGPTLVCFSGKKVRILTYFFKLGRKSLHLTCKVKVYAFILLSHAFIRHSVSIVAHTCMHVLCLELLRELHMTAVKCYLNSY